MLTRLRLADKSGGVNIKTLMTDKYILDEKGNPVAEPDLRKWGSWFHTETKKRKVAKDQIGDSEVSTVFLGLDHNYSGEGVPILWETMVFGGTLDEEQERCSGGREQALAMHARMVEKVKSASK